MAAQPTIHFDLASTSLDQALLQYGRVSRLEVILPATGVSKYRIAPLKGTYTAEEAMAIMLKGTDLQAIPSGSGVLLVRQLNPERLPAPGVVTLAAYGQPAENLDSPGRQGPFSTPAAGSPGAQVGAPSPSSASLGEVVVTAQRRTENLERVPVAVTAFSATALETHVAQNSEQLLAFVPNVVATSEGNQPGQANYYFRGLGNPDGLQTFDAPVVTYVDEVPLGRIVAANLDFFDISQIEVLRGPQGTLFGRNVTGGAVLYTTRKPSSDFGLTAQAEAGSRSHLDVRATVNAPVTSNLFTSLSAYDLHEDGYLRSAYNNNHYNSQSD